MNTANTLLALFLTLFIGSHQAGIAAADETTSQDLMELAQNEGPAKTGSKLSLDEILDRHYDARGGEKAWGEIESLKFIGAMYTKDAVFTTAAAYKRPDLCRLEFKSGPIYFVEAFNGKIPWQMNPGMMTRPKIMEGKRAKEMIDTCDFEGPLINPKKKGHKVKYLGKQKVNGKSAYVLEASLNTGNVDTYYLDTETFLPFMVKGSSTINDQTVNTTVKLSQFMEVGGIIVPFDYEFIVDDNPSTETMKIQTIELNGKIEDSLFNLPKRPQDLR